jgi:tyrosine decarboxylase / aspartate 1-decarboxylase
MLRYCGSEGGNLTQINREITILNDALIQMRAGFEHLPEFSTEQIDWVNTAKVLQEVAIRNGEHYPYFHPMYAGQMLKPPHPIARLAYALSMWINPNNHALEGGRASSPMELEAVADLARMFGWSTHLGHLCGGGTVSNLEALWIAKQLRPGEAIVASDKAHYTHERLCHVLGIPFNSVATDEYMRMDIEALEATLKTTKIGTVVVTMGTTMVGAVDPLPAILELQKQYKFRIHADAAYGGYFILAASSIDVDTAASFRQLDKVDSLVIDPHKHGMQPYGCGCVLFKDPAIKELYRHNSPYTYLNSSDLHLGEISLECSRPGAAATALWATQRLLPLVPDGEFANNLVRSHQAALNLWGRIRQDKRFLTWIKPELDIVLWTVRTNKASQTNRLVQNLFQETAKNDLHLSLSRVSSQVVARAASRNELSFEADAPEVLCLRSCLMKSEHLDWVDTICQVIEKVTGTVLGAGEALPGGLRAEQMLCSGE